MFNTLGFPGGSGVKNLPKSACQVGNVGLIPGWEGALREGNGNPCQYSCLGNPLERGAWQATVHGLSKTWTRLSN